MAHGVEERDVVADRGGLRRGRDEGEQALQPAGVGHEPLLHRRFIGGLHVELARRDVVAGFIKAAFGLEQVIDGGGHGVHERLRVAAAQDGDPVDVVKQVADDCVLGEHLGDRGGADVLTDRAVLLVAVGVGGECFLEVLGDADVVDDEAGRLVLEGPVDPGDRLHQASAAHRLVDVHGVHGWGVEAGQPHVPDDHQLQRIARIGSARLHGTALLLVADVRLVRRRVGGVAGHDDLDDPLGVVVAVPLGPERDDRGVQVDRDAPRHRHDHRLAGQDLAARFPVDDDVGGELLDPLLGADDGLDLGPLGLQPLADLLLRADGGVLELVVDLVAGLLGQLDAWRAAARRRP